MKKLLLILVLFLATFQIAFSQYQTIDAKDVIIRRYLIWHDDTIWFDAFLDTAFRYHWRLLELDNDDHEHYALLAGRTGDILNIDTIRALDSDGLSLFDDSNLGLFIKDGGNIGIGTTNPLMPLHIRGGSSTGGHLMLENTDSPSQWSFRPWGAVNNFSIFDDINSKHRMVFINSGNIGINTTSPAYMLQVVDNIGCDTLFGKHDWDSIYNTPTTLSGYGITDAYTKVETRGVIHDTADVLRGEWRIDIHDSLVANSQGFITGNENITLSGDITGSGTTAITTSIEADSIHTVKTSLSGILKATSGILSTITDNSATWNTALQWSDTNNQLFTDYNGTLKQNVSDTNSVDATRYWVGQQGYGNVSISGTPANNQVTIWTDANTIEGTNSFIFDGTNTGIGLTNPEATLHVNTTTIASIFERNIGTGSAPTNRFYKSRGTSTTKLDVNPGDQLGSFQFWGYKTGDYRYGYIITSYVEDTTASNLSSYLTFSSVNSSFAYAERMRITADGNVGIGLTNPGKELQVAGDFYASGDVKGSTLTGTLSTTLTRGYGLLGNNFNNSVATTWKVDTSQIATQYDISGFGAGSVTSVGLALPVSEFNISGSPVTTSGTLTATWDNQTTNKIFSAPNGSTGVPTFRALVANDVPNHDILNGFVSQKHYYQKDIDTVNNALSGLAKLTSGVISAITDNSATWNTALQWSDTSILATHYWVNSQGFITSTLSKETVQDYAWDVLGGTQTLITVTYQDATNDVDFVVNDDLSLYSNVTSGFITGNETINLTGDVTGSHATDIVCTVVDDSHNHIISNVDGLQTALDGKYDEIAATTNYLTKFGTSGTTVLESVIFDNGNVGISDATPTWGLDVNKHSRFVDSVRFDDAYLYMKNLTQGAEGSGDSAVLVKNSVTGRLMYLNISDVASGGGGGGGESNTASSQGSGTSIYFQKSGVDLQFNAIKSENALLGVSLDAASHDVELTVESDLSQYSNATSNFGNVLNTGTPLNTQIAIWTNATTIKGIGGFELVSGGNDAYISLDVTDQANAIYIWDRTYGTSNKLNLGVTSTGNNLIEAQGDSVNIFTLDTTGTTYFLGNIGIGSTAPAQKLDVNGVIRSTGLKIHSFSGTTIGLNALILDGVDVEINNLSNDFAAISDSSKWILSGTHIYSANSGNVGIGSTTPAQKLDVNGTIQMTGFKLTTSPTNGHVLKSDASGIGTWQAEAVDGDWTVLGNDIYSSVSDNVGIGVSNPAQKLQVVGDIGASGDIEAEANLICTDLISDAGVTAFIKYGNVGVNDANLQFHNLYDVENTMIIDSSGNVGIADNTPTYKLDINGTLRTTGNTIFDGSVTIAATNALGKLKIHAATDQNIYFSSAYSLGGAAVIGAINDAHSSIRGMQIRGNPVIFMDGGVGIGVTNPQNKLDIEGGCVIGAAYSGANTAPTYGLLVEGNTGIGSVSPLAKLDVNGGVCVNVVTKTTTYTATAADYVILCDPNTGGSSFDLTLPATSQNGQLLTIKNISTAGAYTVSVKQGAATKISLANLEGGTLTSDGSNWHVIGITTGH